MQPQPQWEIIAAWGEKSACLDLLFCLELRSNRINHNPEIFFQMALFTFLFLIFFPSHFIEMPVTSSMTVIIEAETPRVNFFLFYFLQNQIFASELSLDSKFHRIPFVSA